MNLNFSMEPRKISIDLSRQSRKERATWAAEKMIQQANLRLGPAMRQVLTHWIKTHSRGKVTELSKDALVSWLVEFPGSQISSEQNLFLSEIAWLEACAEYYAENQPDKNGG